MQNVNVGPLGFFSCTDTAEVDKALYKIVSKKPEVLILNCIADLRCKYIFPLVNYFIISDGFRSWFTGRAQGLESSVLLL